MDIGLQDTVCPVVVIWIQVVLRAYGNCIYVCPVNGEKTEAKQFIFILDSNTLKGQCHNMFHFPNIYYINISIGILKNTFQIPSLD